MHVEALMWHEVLSSGVFVCTATSSTVCVASQMIIDIDTPSRAWYVRCIPLLVVPPSRSFYIFSQLPSTPAPAEHDLKRTY